MSKVPPPETPKKPAGKRGTDRRSGKNVSAPPYSTREGLVLEDRRSHLERRACWVRSIAIDMDDTRTED
ncbi:MAG: hypothetical protein KA603_09585 [Azonexus sp.]|jgi:hypothetical protein|nr:hypothetical protein [Betaproteobacteria bacterium]MBK8918000.1 hypothetical protein [Betaproteobacteria bacterium]MBP6036371.1 hypothetical protein [Azonexus sp.]MBP6906980.1 hypothetical protein [Azonexus sp.]